MLQHPATSLVFLLVCVMIICLYLRSRSFEKLYTVFVVSEDGLGYVKGMKDAATVTRIDLVFITPSERQKILDGYTPLGIIWIRPNENDILFLQSLPKVKSILCIETSTETEMANNMTVMRGDDDYNVGYFSVIGCRSGFGKNVQL